MLIFLLNVIYSAKETDELDLGTANSFQIKQSIIEEKILAYNMYIVDCLLQNVKTSFRIFVEAKAQDEVFFLNTRMLLVIIFGAMIIKREIFILK